MRHRLPMFLANLDIVESAGALTGSRHGHSKRAAVSSGPIDRQDVPVV
jgi:hypothetical protein